MKLCFIAAANSIHSVRWIRYFAHRGHETIWISLSQGDPSDLGVHFHRVGASARFGRWPLGIPLDVLEVRRLLSQARPDVVHAHSVGLHGIVAALAGATPLIVTAWGGDVLATSGSRVRGVIVRNTLKRARLVTCDAAHMKRAMTNIGVPAGKIEVVYFGTDTRQFRPTSSKRALRAVLGLNDGPTVISTRSHYPVYNIDTLVRAIPLVLREQPAARFLLLGDGPDRPALAQLVVSLGVAHAVRLVGAVSNTDLARYVSGADVYVSTSLADAGLAASTAEAMACEVPPVVTDSAENSLWIQNDINGFLVPLRDPRALASRIVELLLDPDLRQRLGAAARRTIVERNDFHTEMAKMELLYERVATASR